MYNILIGLIYIVVIIAVVIGILTLLRKYLFPKVRINKYILLGMAIAGLLVQWFGKFNAIVNAVLMVFIVVFFAWYLDIQQTGGPKKTGKKVVIKAKAKPNRIKNNK